MSDRAPYRRVVVKVSGESFCGPGAAGIQPEALTALAEELQAARGAGAQLAVVVGAGNFVRGRQLADRAGITRPTGDDMGMLCTVVNALALRDALTARGLPAAAMSAVPVGALCDPFDRRRAIRRLAAGDVVVFAGGTGCPFFTTDMCAALRAAETGADAVLKATKVDGVFDSDPHANPDARKYERLAYRQVLADRLGVMDLPAVALCMENHIPVLVFRLAERGNLARAVAGEAVGTLIAD
jgi:uridylate kinase